MRDYHGIIFAYNAEPELRELVSERTAASIPFCGRYRVIDFALSSLRNAGILDVGVIMHRDYQSLLNHLGSGKPWDMSRRVGGLRLLPPFGLPGNHSGNYCGTMEALNAVRAYVQDIPQNHIVLLKDSVCANIDLDKVIKQHQESEAEITAICADHVAADAPYHYMTDDRGYVEKILFDSGSGENTVSSLEGYVIHKGLLLRLMDRCRAENLCYFHRNAISEYLRQGGKMNVYIHRGYSRIISSVDAYYGASMDMLCSEKRRQVFPAGRPVCSKFREEVSTYYGENAVSRRCLVADNCIIEGEIENCIIFSGVRIGCGAKLHDCIIMSGCIVGEGSQLDCVIADKAASFPHDTVLKGSRSLPVVVPKKFKI